MAMSFDLKSTMLSSETLSVFVAVAEAGSFTAAAERLGLTPSGISRSIAKLEKQLGVRLITRTTRRLDLTAEGQWLLESARDILTRLQETTLTLQSAAEHPSGLLRVNAATPVFNHLLAPLLPAFQARYPRIRLELVSGESIVDLIEERADVAIRVGALQGSGQPDTVDALATHSLLGFTQPASLNIWPLRHAGGDGYPVQAAISTSNGETLRHLALNGSGIACLSDFLTADDRLAGRLVEVLPAQTLDWWQPIWAVYYRQGFLAARVSHFVAFLAEHLQPLGTDGAPGKH